MFVELTDEAIIKLQEKTSKSGNKNIRIGVTGSGCSGYAYVFDFLQGEPNEDDHQVDYGTFSIWTNEASIEYLEGMRLDYQIQGINEGFTFINPNAKAYCGCGESFTI